jgi:hypothetical protein
MRKTENILKASMTTLMACINEAVNVKQSLTWVSGHQF